MRRFFSALLALFFVYMLFQFIQILPKYGDVDLSKRVSERFIVKNVSRKNEKVVYMQSRNLEDGSANVVTSVVVNYRSFDTLGEVTVLFVSALGVGLYMGGFKKLSCDIKINNTAHRQWTHLPVDNVVRCLHIPTRSSHTGWWLSRWNGYGSFRSSTVHIR